MPASSVQKKLRMLVSGVAPLPMVFMTWGANDSYPYTRCEQPASRMIDRISLVHNVAWLVPDQCTPVHPVRLPDESCWYFGANPYSCQSRQISFNQVRPEYLSIVIRFSSRKPMKSMLYLS